MGADALMKVLHQLPKPNDKDLLIGPETADDAAVYRVSDTRAIVTSLDFFPPIVDDAYTFGEITAANALSDIYAMGALPNFATAIVCFPKKLPLQVLSDILRGATDKLKEAGAVLAGGHSIEDAEVKFGLSVSGFVEIDKILRNSTAKVGDVLVLTKPLGVGVIMSAIKNGKYSEAEAEEVFTSMKTLNGAASGVALEFEASALTDVTGFGLLGHAFEMAEGSGATLVIRSKDVPLFNDALKLIAKRKNRPRAIETNSDFLKGSIDVAEDIDKDLEMLFYDPQTSGGLLISVAEERAEALLEALNKAGVNGVQIGAVIERGAKAIRVE